MIMKSVNATVNQYSMISSSGIHDATLHGFNYLKGVHFEACLRDLRGQEKWICLVDLIELGFKNLVTGTIISEIFCWPLSEDINLQTQTKEAWHVLLAENYHEKDFEKRIAEMKKQNATASLVLFESSYGGSIAAVCKGVRIGLEPNAPPPSAANS
jgi:hypothetical protein